MRAARPGPVGGAVMAKTIRCDVLKRMAVAGNLLYVGGYTFDDLELDIEPYSMERTSEAVQQRRMQEAVLVATQIAPLIPQLPYVRWKKLLDLIGDTINVPDLSEMVDFNAAD